MPFSLQKLFFLSAFVFLLLPVFPVSSQSPNTSPQQSFFSKVISFEWISSFFSHFFQQKTTFSSLLIGEDTPNTPPSNLTASSSLPSSSSSSSASSPSPWLFVCPRYHAFFSKEAISSKFTACTSQKEYQGSTCACEDDTFTKTDVTSQASWSVTLPEGSGNTSFASVSTDGTVTGDAKKLPRGIGIGYAKVSASLNEKKDTSEVSVQMPNGGFNTITTETGDEGGGGNGGGGNNGQCVIHANPCPGDKPCENPSGYPNITVFTPYYRGRNFIPACLGGKWEGNCDVDNWGDFYATYKTGNMPSGHIYSGKFSLNTKTSFQIEPAPSGTKEQHNSVSIWISTVPGKKGEFPDDGCNSINSNYKRIHVIDPETEKDLLSDPNSRYSQMPVETRKKLYCVLPMNTLLYFNVTPSGIGAIPDLVDQGYSAKDCGKPEYQCRTNITTNVGSSDDVDAKKCEENNTSPTAGGQCTKPSGTLYENVNSPLRLTQKAVDDVTPYGMISNANGILVYEATLIERNFIRGCIDGRNEHYKRTNPRCAADGAGPSDRTIYASQVVAPDASYGEWHTRFQVGYSSFQANTTYANGVPDHYKMWVSYAPGGNPIDAKNCSVENVNNITIGSETQQCIDTPFGDPVCLSQCRIEPGCMFYVNFQNMGNGNDGKPWAVLQLWI